MTLHIKQLFSIGAVDSGDNPEAEIVFWKRRKAKLPVIRDEADMEAAMGMLRRRPDDEEPRFDVVCINHWSERPDTDTTADSFKRALAKCRAMGWTPKVIVDGRARNFSEGPHAQA